MPIKSYITLSREEKLYKKFPECTNFLNKLEGLSLASFSSLVYCLWVRSGTYSKELDLADKADLEQILNYQCKKTYIVE
jgi:hypothetical protein